MNLSSIEVELARTMSRFKISLICAEKSIMGIFKIGIILAMSVSILNVGFLIGRWKEITAPQLRPENLKFAPTSVDNQRQALIDYAHKICLTFNPCSESSLHQKTSESIQICRRAARQIADVQLPGNLPPSVTKNLEIYHQSMINSANKIADSWDIDGQDGGSFWTHIFNWEIDTSSPQSIPQKIYRLYGFSSKVQLGIVSCKEIASIYELSRTPAAQ